MSRKNTLEDFYSYFEKPDEKGCVKWLGRVGEGGYGLFAFHNKQHSAHRFHYFQKFPEADKNLLVCHTCDNRACVALEHLFLGTHQDNMDDMLRKHGHWMKRGGLK